MSVQNRTGDADWDDLRVFLALAAHGSLSATARALGLSHATVGRRLAALEARLGQSLVDRGAQGWRLTAAGAAVAAAARPMTDAALEVSRVTDRRPGLEGLVRLTATRSVADHLVAPSLGELARRHPAVTIEILTGTRRFSLARREADLALRFGRPDESTLVGRRLVTLKAALFAAPPVAAEARAGAAVPLIGFDAANRLLPEAVWLAAAFPDRRYALRSDSQSAQAEAARAGLGLALLPWFVAADLDGLEAVAIGPPPPTRDVWLLIRPDLATVPRVRAVADHLIGLFATLRPPRVAG